MNRLQRDQIVNRALDLVDSPSLDTHDRPSNPTIATGAFSVQWLQDAIDLFHNEFPVAGTVKSTAVTIPVSGTLSLPSDFILDVRDGILMDASSRSPAFRAIRIALQRLLNLKVFQTSTGTPKRYALFQNPLVMSFHPTPDQSYTGTLYYYALPATLASTDVPLFPSDWVLTEYLRLRGLEWVRKLPEGSAWQYAQREIANLRKAGLFNEPESDTIPLDHETFRRAEGAYWDWMTNISGNVF